MRRSRFTEGQIIGVLREHEAGVKAADLSDAQVAAIESSARTGRPLGDEAFVEGMEKLTGRTLARQKPGPKVKAGS